jgi:hypothetical protein
LTVESPARASCPWWQHLQYKAIASFQVVGQLLNIVWL